MVGGGAEAGNGVSLTQQRHGSDAAETLLSVL